MSRPTGFRAYRSTGGVNVTAVHYTGANHRELMDLFGPLAGWSLGDLTLRVPGQGEQTVPVGGWVVSVDGLLWAMPPDVFRALFTAV